MLYIIYLNQLRLDESISLNKFISDTGYCSRREADQLITDGRVILNGQTATLGNRYNPGDVVEVDGSYVTADNKDKRIYIALNKPTGITTTTELHIKDNIISFVNHPKRIFPIGRLDKDSEGLILLTNDGDIINKILRASNDHEKEYIVRVNKPIDSRFLQQMSQGVPILDTRTLPCKVQSVGRQTFRITLTQGLNRQIRRMCEYLGYEVMGLQRVRIMNIKLDKLATGKWRYLSEAELAVLMNHVTDSNKENTEVRRSARNKNEHRASHAPSRAKPGIASKEKTSSHHEKSSKPFSKDGRTRNSKGGEKPWKREDTPKKSVPAKPGKNVSTQKKKSDKPHESRKEKRTGAAGSFKNYRSKGRRS